MLNFLKPLKRQKGWVSVGSVSGHRPRSCLLLNTRIVPLFCEVCGPPIKIGGPHTKESINTNGKESGIYAKRVPESCLFLSFFFAHLSLAEPRYSVNADFESCDVYASVRHSDEHKTTNKESRRSLTARRIHGAGHTSQPLCVLQGRKHRLE